MESVADNPAQVRPLGRMLSEERERQGLSRADVAQRLHMSPWQVEALEGGVYERLPRGMFLRGFVRNYARVLHLDPEKVLPLLADAAPKAQLPRIVVPTQNIRFDPMGERLASPYVKAAGLAVVAVSLAFAAMYWWLFIRPTPPATESTRKPAVVPAQPTGSITPQQVAVAPVAPVVTPPPMDAPRDEAPAQPIAAPAPTPRPVSPPAPRGEPVRIAATTPAPPPVSTTEAPLALAAPGEKRVRFRFKGDSWLEVRDARGRTLVSKLHQAGAEAEVVGRAPLTVVIGNAPEVEMTYDDRAYDLQPHSRVGVARVSLQ